MSKLLVIVGVTGNQGSSTAEAFLKDPSWKVRGTSRDPEKPASQALATKGVEIVYGDIDDVESLKEAFRGATVVFGNTAFDAGAVMFPTADILAKLNPGQTPGDVAYDKEVQQGKNIADAVAAAVGDGLELFIWSTLSDAKKWSNGKYPNIYHFNTKAAVVDYIHDKHPALAAKMSLLQLGWFVTNWKWGKASVPWEKQSDGSMVLRTPGSGDWKIPLLQPTDTGKFVKALTKLPPGKNLLAYGDLLSMTEYVEMWSRASGIPARLESVTLDDHARLAPGGWGQEIGDMIAYMQEFGYWGGADTSVLFAKDLGSDVKVTRIEEYMRNEDWSEMLK